MKIEMIGLEFVKNVDGDWKKRITFADGSPYYEDFCPLSRTKCRHEDCSFWNYISNDCGYLSGRSDSIDISLLEKDSNINEIERFLNHCRMK